MTKTGWVILIILAIVVSTMSAWVVVDGSNHVEMVNAMKAEIAVNTKTNQEQQAAMDKRLKEVDAELKRVDMQLEVIVKAIQELEKDVKALNDRGWLFNQTPPR